MQYKPTNRALGVQSVQDGPRPSFPLNSTSTAACGTLQAIQKRIESHSPAGRFNNPCCRYHTCCQIQAASRPCHLQPASAGTSTCHTAQRHVQYMCILVARMTLVTSASVQQQQQKQVYQPKIQLAHLHHSSGRAGCNCSFWYLRNAHSEG